MISKQDKIWVTGHKGMVGSAICRLLRENGFGQVITSEKSEVNLLNQEQTEGFALKHRPDYIILAAARVGGINANMQHPGSFLYENLQIQNHVIHSAYLAGVKKLVFLGSSCIYPKECPQPMKEEYLLTGPLEPTNEGYALAKIAGLKMCAFYEKEYGLSTISLMPCNLYGPNDSFDLAHSHVLSALVKRFSDAVKNNVDEITLWGTGIARREFMHVDDLAAALLYMMEHYESSEFINIGWGEDVSIKALAEMIAEKTGFTGKISWDDTKPNGMLRKCMDVSRMEGLGFKPKITLDEGISQMIGIYQSI